MKAHTLLRVLVSIAAALLFGSCTGDGGTIYATIEAEQKTTDNTLANTLTISDIVRTAANTYYIAAGTIFAGVLDPLANKVTWTPNATSAERVYNPTGSLSNAVGFDGTNLWAGFITTGANLGLYSTALPPTTTWTQIIDPVVKDKQVTLIQAIGAHLFVVTATALATSTAYTYELDHYTLGAWSAPLLTGLAAPIVGVAFDGTNYYVASGTTVYYDGSPAGAFATTGLTLAAGDEVTGILGVAGKVLVTTKKSGIHQGTTTSWTAVSADPVNSITVPLFSVAGPVDSGDKYLVGSDGFGYYTFSVSAGTLTRFSDSTIGLYTASVRRILFDGGNRAVFMGTNGAGLWRATLDTSGTPTSAGWTHE